MNDKTYTFYATGNISHNNVDYAPGDEIELTRSEATVLTGTISKTPPSSDEDDLFADEDEEAGQPSGQAPDNPDAIIRAIGELEPGNPAHWTKTGKPQVEALEGRLGHQITAQARDEAWNRYQAENAG